jgi:hypothetical protein
LCFVLKIVNLFKSVSPAPQCVQKDNPEEYKSNGAVKTGEGKRQKIKVKSIAFADIASVS